MELLRTIIGWSLSRAGYVLGIVVLIYGILTAIAGTFDWKIFLGGLALTTLMHVVGQYLMEGKALWQYTKSTDRERRT